MVQPISETSAQSISGETAGYQLAPILELNAVVTLASEGIERTTEAGGAHLLRRKPIGTEKEIIVTETAITVKGARIAS
jgi:hypothetical protein